MSAFFRLSLISSASVVRVYLVRGASGSPSAESREIVVRRMERHGAEIVTAGMVVFEWLGSAAHPRFCEIMGRVK